MTKSAQDQILPDARKDNWVDRFAPPPLRPWFKLGRFDRPIGIWLLMLPGLMGVSLEAVQRGTWPNPLHFLMFLAGAAMMRAAGCAFNDIADRDLDALVERTRGRPLASGQISPKQAVAFIIGLCLLSLIILINLSATAIGLGIASLALVAAYPFMKRITWWPQAWLGLTYNWGVLMGYGVNNALPDLPVILLYVGLVFWTLGYDTIYAVQDLEDDALAGIKSTARRLGASTQIGVAVFYAIMMCLVTTALILAGLKPLCLLGLGLTLGHLMWQVLKIRLDDGPTCLMLFKSNTWTGMLLVVSILLGLL